MPKDDSASGAKKVSMGVDIDPRLQKALRMAKALYGVTISMQVEEALWDLLSKDPNLQAVLRAEED